MLGKWNAIATLAVKDLKRAAEFYEGTLGFERVQTMGEEAVGYRSGSSTMFVYRSQYAGTNKATAATWNVEDGVDELVRALKQKGVVFKHYDLPDMTLDGDVHVAGGQRVAWFTDPDGNILSIAGR